MDAQRVVGENEGVGFEQAVVQKILQSGPISAAQRVSDHVSASKQI
jgi:hypothetical protein